MNLFRNALFNLAGSAVPALLAIFTIPYIVKSLGASDYGLLTLVTSIVGYFALLDINVTAASTKYISQYSADNDNESLYQTIIFGVITYSIIGFVGMLSLYLLGDVLIIKFFGIEEQNQVRAGGLMKVAALGFFISQIQTYLQSIPGALARYDISARIEAVFGTAVTLLTVLFLYLDMGLIELIWLRVILSFLQTCVIIWLLRKLLPSFRFIAVRRSVAVNNFSFSLYSFLSKIASVTYVNADKLIIGAKIGTTPLTYYVVPVSLVSRVMALVYRLASVMLPHASFLATQKRWDELRSDYLITSRYVCFLNGLLATLMAAYSAEILALWLSPEFAKFGSPIMIAVAISYWVDSLTNIPSLVNDGLGNPKISGFFSLLRAAFGLIFIFIGVSLYSIEGAAYGQLLSTILASVSFLIYVHIHTLRISLIDLIRCVYAPVLIVLAPVFLVSRFLAFFQINGWGMLFFAVVFSGLISFAGGYVMVLSVEHKANIRRLLGMMS